MPNAADSHPLSHLPTSKRIDAVMAILSSMDTQEGAGWTIADLAELCGCSTKAIHARQQAALNKLKAHHPNLQKEIEQ